jgi:hypothetical protein
VSRASSLMDQTCFAKGFNLQFTQARYVCTYVSGASVILPRINDLNPSLTLSSSFSLPPLSLPLSLYLPGSGLSDSGVATLCSACASFQLQWPTSSWP